MTDWPQEQRASIPPRFRNGIPPDYDPSLIRIEDAQDKALTAFWRGLMIGAVLASGAAFFAGAVWAGAVLL